MKIECVKDKLFQVVSNVERVTGKNLPLSVLGNVVFNVSKSSAVLESTNLDLSIKQSIPSKVLSEGTCAVSGILLSQYLQNLPKDSKVTLEKIDNNLHISSTSGSAVIKTSSTEDFPLFSTDLKNSDYLVSVGSVYFVEVLNKISYAASYSDIKPEIASVNLNIKQKEMILTATDSFRLAQIKVPSKNVTIKTDDDYSILIPVRNTNEITKILDSTEDDVDIYVQENQLILKTSNIYLTSRLVDGVFPDVEQIFPSRVDTDVVVLKNDLLQGLKTSNVFSDKFNRIGFKISPKDKVFELYSKNQDTGESNQQVSATVKGEDLDIQFNAKYILDVFQSVKEDSINLRFNGKDKPLVISGVSNNNFIYLAMPLNT